MGSLQGHFLVASPHLMDPNFYRSVVLMIQHDEDGGFGLVLNRCTDNSVSEIWELIGELPAEHLDPDLIEARHINLGGPVAGPLMALHNSREVGENQIVPGVFLTTDKQGLNRLLESDDLTYRIFSGYSGWGSGQLESELEDGGWLTAPASADDIFHNPETMWKKISQQIGLGILGTRVTRFVPEDPSLN